MKRWLLLSAVLVVGAAGYFFFIKKSEITQPVVTGSSTESSEKAGSTKNAALTYGKKKSGLASGRGSADSEFEIVRSIGRQNRYRKIRQNTGNTGSERCALTERFELIAPGFV